MSRSGRRFTFEEKQKIVEMRAAGHFLSAIAESLGGASVSSIAYQLDLREGRQLRGERVRSQAWRQRNLGENNHYGLVQAHVRRSVRQVLASPEIRMSAARAFAAGEISRSELMMRITP